MSKLRTIQEVKKKHEASLLKIQGVVSVGIGLNKDKIPAIIIGVEQNNPKVISLLPADIEGFPTEIQIVGKIKAQ